MFCQCVSLQGTHLGPGVSLRRLSRQPEADTIHLTKQHRGVCVALICRLLEVGLGLCKVGCHQISIEIDFAKPKLCCVEALSRCFLVQSNCLGRIAWHPEAKLGHM